MSASSNVAHRRGVRRARRAAIVALLVCSANAIADDVPGVRGHYTWEYTTPGATGNAPPVDKTVDGVAGRLFFYKRASFAPEGGAGPRSTKADVVASGMVIADKRKFSARVEAGAQAVAWDPDAPETTLGALKDTSVSSEVVLEDEVEVDVPESDLPEGAPVEFYVQPMWVSGKMSVPPSTLAGGANGTAQLTVYLTVTPVGGGEPQFRPLEDSLPNGNDTSKTYEREAVDLHPIGQPPAAVIVANKARYRFRVVLYVAAGLTPDYRNPRNPPRDTATSDFAHTAYWGGLAGFRDAAGRPLPNVAIRSAVGFDWKTVRATPVPPDVVEYYNAALDHYFITPLAAEQDFLDAGGTPTAWVRTGESFGYYAAPAAGTSPVCRFYIPPALGDSHFFGRGTAECEATAARNPSFTLESAAFLHMVLPTAGNCPAGTVPVYRVFSNRPDANHRYTTSRAIRDQMVARGWLAEGDGPDLVVMCAPA